MATAVASARAAQTVAPRATRMTLDKVVKGVQEEPLRVLLYSPEGLGKSTFASNAPNPIFLATEDGTAQLDVARFPRPTDWQDVLDAVATLEREQHDYRTLVIDTLDHAEPLVWSHVCSAAKVDSIEAVGGGFGKGYVAAMQEWRGLAARLERLQVSKGMHVVMLAHCHVKTIHLPDTESYDRYQLKLNDKAAGFWKEWSSIVLFGQYETLTAKDEKTKRVKGVSTGARIVQTVRTAAWDAKNRHGLPETLALSWADLEQAIAAHRPADPAELKAAIVENVAQLDDATRATALGYLEKAGDDAVKLTQLNGWVNARIAQKGE